MLPWRSLNTTGKARSDAHLFKQNVPGLPGTFAYLVEKIRRAGQRKGLREGMLHGLEKGMQQGLAEGRRKEVLRIAGSMREDSLPPAMIIIITGLTEDDIRSLRH